MTRKEQQERRLEEMTRLEREFWDAGRLRVAGMDEVGRGPLAGPVVGACVILPPDDLILGINDSKKLSPARREALAVQIHARALFVGIGQVESQQIDELNILNATKKALMAACTWQEAPDFLLFDTVPGLRPPCPSRGLVKGDALSYSIAAASIVAKVYRDGLMQEYDRQYPQYGFARNKGYGTAEHMEALRRYGPCPIHRRSFITRILQEADDAGE